MFYFDELIHENNKQNHIIKSSSRKLKNLSDKSKMKIGCELKKVFYVDTDKSITEIIKCHLFLSYE